MRREWKRPGVQRRYLFGSTARDEAREDSDVDLFFDCERGRLSLFDLMEVKEQAARILGRKSEIMTRDSPHKVLARRSKPPRCNCSDAGASTGRTSDRYQ
jgi:predicted nucleotidyltransferase